MDNIKSHYLQLDMAKSEEFRTISIWQGENKSNQLEMDLTHQFQSFNPTVTKTIILYDNEYGVPIVQSNATYANGKVSCTIPDGIYQSVGRVRGQISLYNGEVKTQSGVFFIEVKQSVGIEAMAGKPEWGELDKAFEIAEKAEEWKIQEEQRKTNELDRVKKENDRNTAEVNRESSETTRKSAESGRVSAENIRVNQESGRVTSFNNIKKQYEDALALGNADVAIAEIKNFGMSDYIYNVNALSKTRSLIFDKIICIGDSIGAGSSASSNNGFINQLNSTLQYHQGFINYSTASAYYGNNGWNKEEDGICKLLLSSSDATKPITLYDFSWNTPTFDYMVNIVYSKRTDGGELIVTLDNDTALGILNCNGNKQDGIISPTYVIPKGRRIRITPKANGKAYFNHFMIKYKPNTKSHEIENWSVGGRKASDYTLEQLKLMISYRPFDVLVWELFANDWSGQDLDAYKNRTEYIMTEAKKLGMDIIIPITCGNEFSNSTEEIYTRFRNEWVGYLYDVARRYNCCIIDYDKKFGGHKKAKANGLIADTIHPTLEGHTLMANDLCNVLLGMDSVDSMNLGIFNGDTRTNHYGANAVNKDTYFSKTLTFEKGYTLSCDNNGNPNSKLVQPIIRVGNILQLPKYAPLGALATQNKDLYINTTESDDRTTPATWTILNRDLRDLRATYTDNNGNHFFKDIYPITKFDSSFYQLPKYAPSGALALVGRNLYVNVIDWGSDKTTQSKWESIIANEIRIETITSAPTDIDDKYLNRILRYVKDGQDDQFITYTKTGSGGRRWVRFNTENFSW